MGVPEFHGQQREQSRISVEYWGRQDDGMLDPSEFVTGYRAVFLLVISKRRRKG